MSVGGIGGRRIDPEDLASPGASDVGASAMETPAAATPAAPPGSRRPGALPAGTVGTLPDGTSISFDPETGSFMARRGSATRVSSRALYQAAQLVAEGNVGFIDRLDEAGRAKLAATLTHAMAKDRGDRPPSRGDLEWRSGSATIALALLRKLPEGDPLKAEVLEALFAQTAKEPVKGLKATTTLNLEAAADAGEIVLTEAQRATLAAAKEATLPSKPPYDQWFKDGKTDLNVKQYIHPEFYDAMLSGYTSQGFRKVADIDADRIELEKTYTDRETGRTMKVNVEVIRTYAEGHKPEKRLFDDMSDPSTDIEFYTGHSNLGGNVLGALAAGPKEQDGAKWVINWMCRGTQVLADVYNRFPDAHYTTTTDPAWVIHSDKFVNGMFQGIVERKGYDEIWDKMGNMPVWWKPGLNLRDWFLAPNDPRILKVRDLDKDGRVDLSALSGLDPLYNVGLARTHERAPRFEPVPTRVNPQDIPGDKVMRGVNFLNTILTYHLDEEEHPGGNDGRLPKNVGDKVFAGGWYVSDGDEIVKVEEKKVGDETVYEVKVNSKYKDQDVDTLGAAMAYEVNKHLTVKKNGEYTEQDKLRGILLAGEYCAYMGESYEEVSAIIEGMAKKYGFNDRLTWDNVIAAIDADRRGYVSPDATRELKRRIGSADPRLG